MLRLSIDLNPDRGVPYLMILTKIRVICKYTCCMWAEGATEFSGIIDQISWSFSAE